jgi:hypothetical protein
MLFRDNNGNIINISRLNYHDDKTYYNKVRNTIKNKETTIEYKFNIEATPQYTSLLNKLI